MAFNFRISKTGYEVTGNVQKQIIDANYPACKSRMSGKYLLVKPAGDVGVTVTIEHGLGYKPICFVSGWYIDINAYGTLSIVERYKDFSWNSTPGVSVYNYYAYWADTTNLYIDFYTQIFSADTVELKTMYQILYEPS